MLPHLEALFGGAAGGGKTDCALMSFLQYAHVPGYSQIIFRRRKTDLNLPDSVLSRAHAWWSGTAAEWSGELYGYVFPTLPGQPPSVCAFSYLAKDLDRFRYQSAAFQCVWFEELTQFTEPQYTYLFSRIRKPKTMPVPLRMRSTSNPGGVGHDWVRSRFIQHMKPESTHFVSPPTEQEIEVAKEMGTVARGAAFVPSKLADNPGIDPSYRASLARLSSTERKQLEEGDWDAILSGEFFRRDLFQFIKAAPPGLRGCRYWDLASTEPHDRNKDPDWTAGSRLHVRDLWAEPRVVEGKKLKREYDGMELYFTDVRRTRRNSGGVETFIKKTASEDGRRLRIFIEEEPGSAGKNNTLNYQTRVLPGYPVEGHKKTGDKESFWKSLSAQGEAGRIYLVEGDWNEEFIRELCALPNGKKDMADSASGAFDRLLTTPESLRLRMLLGLS